MTLQALKQKLEGSLTALFCQTDKNRSQVSHRQLEASRPLPMQFTSPQTVLLTLYPAAMVLIVLDLQPHWGLEWYKRWLSSQIRLPGRGGGSVQSLHSMRAAATMLLEA